MQTHLALLKMVFECWRHRSVMSSTYMYTNADAMSRFQAQIVAQARNAPVVKRQTCLAAVTRLHHWWHQLCFRIYISEAGKQWECAVMCFCFAFCGNLPELADMKLICLHVSMKVPTMLWADSDCACAHCCDSVVSGAMSCMCMSRLVKIRAALHM